MCTKGTLKLSLSTNTFDSFDTERSAPKPYNCLWFSIDDLHKTECTDVKIVFRFGFFSNLIYIKKFKLRRKKTIVATTYQQQNTKKIN